MDTNTLCNFSNRACSSLTIEAWASVRIGAASLTGVLLVVCRSPRGLRDGREEEEEEDEKRR